MTINFMFNSMPVIFYCLQYIDPGFSKSNCLGSPHRQNQENCAQTFIYKKYRLKESIVPSIKTGSMCYGLSEL